MARQAMWVHGNSAVMRFPGGKGDPSPGNHTRSHQMNGVFDRVGHIEWSDVVGLHRDSGATFRGRTGQRNNFVFSIPTRCWRDGKHANVVMVAFTFTSDLPVVIEAGRLFDGSFSVLSIPITTVGGPRVELVAGVNRFDFQGIQVRFGLAVILDVFFAQEGDITFHAVGADFEV
jgi:hypothetical protein